jgi:predicted molibdopterin-dependent oxidoreductase YjgC
MAATADQPDLLAALSKLSFLVVQDIRLTEIAKAAHVVLPSTHFGEKDGTYTNRKGRVQKLNAALVAPEGALQDCEIFIRLLQAAGERASYSSAAEIFQALSQEIPSYRGLNYDVIGDQGIQLGSGGADPS